MCENTLCMNASPRCIALIARQTASRTTTCVYSVQCYATTSVCERIRVCVCKRESCAVLPGRPHCPVNEQLPLS